MSIETPGGNLIGRPPGVRDAADSRDYRFHIVHPEAAAVPLPTRVDLRAKLPPVWEQELSDCGAHMGDGLMTFLHPEVKSFSRLQIYFNTRVIELSGPNDSGVQTRDIFKSLCNRGAAPEQDWPYVPERFTQRPPLLARQNGLKFRLADYSRIVSETDMLRSLAMGKPFGLGIVVYESIDSLDLARSGVMPMPGPRESIVGGHDVLAVGYEMNLTSTEDFKRSGLDRVRVPERALLIRNSWGRKWGLDGHLWLPLNYASNPSTGGDAWTGRRLS